jgi:uncharacterized protein YwgA
MKRLQRDTILVSLIEALRDRGSWCGETHIQKVSYFLQELLNVPLGFDFILYKHGPYSFDLSDTLAQMEADFIIRPVPKSPFGPTITLDSTSDLLKKKFSKTIKTYASEVEFIADRLARKNVAELERIATAMYVSLGEKNVKNQLPRAKRIHELKPHVTEEQALAAVQEFDEIQSSAKTIQKKA